MDANQKVEPARGASPGGGTGNANLPFELQRVVQQFPVTLYTSGKCTACGEARNLLRQRGVPFTEKTIDSDADQRAFAAVSRDQAVPTVRIGSQVIAGFETGEWNTYLNAAGYPGTSRLPANYQNPAATPLVARSELTAPAATRAPGSAEGGQAAGGAAASPATPQAPSIARRGSAGAAPSPAEAPPTQPTNPAGIRF